MLKENFLLKNARSSSLPLKIMIKNHNDQKQKDKIDSDNRLIKSWNDTNSILNRSFDQISNSNGFYFTYKLSISEHFLDLIEQEEPKLFINQDLFYRHPKKFNLFSLTKKSPNSHIYNSDELNKDDIQSIENIDRQELIDYSSSSSESIKTLTGDEYTNSNAKEYQAQSDNNNNLIKPNKETSNELSSNREKQQGQMSQQVEESKQIEFTNDDSNNQQVQAKSETVESNLLISNNKNEVVQEKQNEEKNNEFDDSQQEQSTISLSSNDPSVCESSQNASSSGFSSSFSELSLSNITSGNASLSDQSDCSLAQNLTSDSINNNKNNRNNDSTINFDNDITLSSSCQDVVDNLSLSNSSSSFENELKIFMPKKSCLKPKLFIDTSSTGNMIDSAYATSSPLSSPFCSSTTCSSLEQSSALNSPTMSNLSLSTNSSSGTKKRVSFADASGKELFTVRTMSEPSNCPPKLTSKIVQYFLNREFSSNSSNCLTNRFGSGSNFFDLGSNYNFDSNRYSNVNSYERNYDYGISALNYSNDVSKLSGSIAVYTLNFNQPASDYLRFRNGLEEKFVSLENVVLNRFQINGTIKVKNVNYHKQVFVRCSFNSWHSYEDIQASFVPCDFYTSAGSISPTQTHISPTFYASNHSIYQPYHKEYDTFKFEFQLPKTVDENNQKSLSTDPNNKSNASASIQFCICYKSGAGSEQKEFWDSNNGQNYEILQYIIDIEKLKPSNKQQQQQQQLTSGSSINNKSVNNKSNQFKYDVSSYSSKMNYVGCLAQENHITGIYY